jgi:serine protease AprX
MPVRTLLSLILLLLTITGHGQTNRYMVFFKDKVPADTDPGKYLSQRAIDRRIRQGLSVMTDQDFPPAQAYITGVKNTGAEVYFKTRWMNGVLIQCASSLVPTIQGLSYVDHVEFVAPQPKLSNSGRNRITLRKKNHVGSESSTQLSMIGIPQMHHDSYHGENISIAIFDGGFQGANSTTPFQHIFNEGRFDAALSHNFVSNSKNVFQYDDHGTMVFSIIAADVPDVFTGGAYKANFSLYVTEDVASEYRIEEYNWLFAAERADSAGVDIINSSLGYYDFDNTSMNYTTAQMDGKTAVVTRAAQWAADRGMLVVCSAGNEGNIQNWKIIAAPADAVDVIAVGNVNASGVRSSSSSIGPAADGRIKPDLVTLGSGVKVIRANGQVSIASGTSLSCPLMTSLAAGVWQRFPNLTNKELIEAVKQTASRSNNPDNEVGYGIPNYTSIVNYFDTTIVQNTVFTVFPNPFVDTVKVRPINPDQFPSCRLEVITSDGRTIADQTLSFTWLNREFAADMAGFSAGVYYFRIWLGEKRFVFKVVKV